MTIALKDIPSGVLPVFFRKAADGATADSEISVFYADVKYKVIAAGYVPDSAITGQDTNYRSISFVDKGTDGSGTTALKTAIAFTNGVDAAALDFKSMIAKADGATIAAGHVVSFKSAHTGASGLALPAGTGVLLLWPISE